MADGSVRFVSHRISDTVFKAMATYQGDMPADFDKDFPRDTRLIEPVK